jgi:hypothetical protein
LDALNDARPKPRKEMLENNADFDAVCPSIAEFHTHTTINREKNFY